MERRYSARWEEAVSSRPSAKNGASARQQLPQRRDVNRRREEPSNGATFLNPPSSRRHDNSSKQPPRNVKQVCEEELKAVEASALDLLGTIHEHHHDMVAGQTKWGEIYSMSFELIRKTLHVSSKFPQAGFPMEDAGSLPGMARVREALTFVRRNCVAEEQHVMCFMHFRGTKKKKVLAAIANAHELLDNAFTDLVPYLAALKKNSSTALTPRLPILQRVVSVCPSPGKPMIKVPQVPPLYAPRVDIEQELRNVFIGRTCGSHSSDPCYTNGMSALPPPCVMLRGASGIGKTALACHFARSSAVLDHYDLIFWLHIGVLAGTDVEVNRLLMELEEMVEMGLQEDGLRPRESKFIINPDQDGLLFKISSALMGKRVLLVMDDMSEHHVHFLGPFLKLNVSILVTTPVDVMQLVGDRFLTIVIPPLSPPESEELFWKVAKRGPRLQSEATREVVDACGGNPLTLCLAGALLSRSMEIGRIGITSAMNTLRERMYLRFGKDNSVFAKCIKGLVDTLEPTDRDLYLMLSALPYGAHAAKFMLQNLWGLETAAMAEEKIQMFQNYCLMHASHSYRVGNGWGLHNLQMDWVKSRVTARGDLLLKMEGRQRRYLSRPVCFKELFNRDRYELARYWNHIGGRETGEELLKRNVGEIRKDFTFVHMLEFFLYDLGLLDTAQRLIALALLYWRQMMRDDTVDVAMSQSNLGFIRERLGMMEESEEMHRSALEIWLKVSNEGDRQVARAMGNLGWIVARRGKLADAEFLFKQALSLQQISLGGCHSAVISTMHHLGMVMMDLGKFREAEETFRVIVSSLCDKLGGSHPLVATFTNSLGMTMDRQCKARNAEQMYRSALSLLVKVFGDVHPDVATAMSDLACLLETRGRLGEAEQLHRNALAIQQKVFGLQHPDVAASMCNLSAVFARQNKFDEAERMNHNALYVLEGVLGESHPDVVALQASLGLAGSNDVNGRF